MTQPKRDPLTSKIEQLFNDSDDVFLKNAINSFLIEQELDELNLDNVKTLLESYFHLRLILHTQEMAQKSLLAPGQKKVLDKIADKFLNDEIMSLIDPQDA